jgi:antitoxin (DNA-binding transcriptional repressor) of toxin-antitoxin stability system
MATYDLEYARERLADLFQEARDGKEVVIVRDDGVSCKLVAASEVWADEPAVIPPGSNKPQAP